MRHVCALWLSAALVAGGLIHSAAAAELLPADQEKLTAIEASLQKARDLYLAKKYVELGELVGSVEKSLEELKGGPSKDELAPMLATLETKLASAQRLLKNALDATPVTAKPAAPPRPTPRPRTPAAPPGGISFVNQIAPLLVGKCARCHTQNPRGGFSIVSYATIDKGSDAGRVYQKGRGPGSTLITLLETGDMPRGGSPMSADEIALISKWIDNGAPFDGTDPTAPITGAAAPAAGGSPAGGPVAMATGNEKISFMRDIAPVLNANCTGCHGGQQGADNMELDTFNRLRRGGRSGDMLSAGNPGNSLLLRMLRGTAKDQMGQNRPRMPRNRPPLTDEIIKKFETWIAEGARFDGDDPSFTLDYGLKIIMARNMNHEELTKYRAELAKKNWSTGNPELVSGTVEGEDYLIVGSISAARMEEIAKIAQAERSKVVSALRIPPGKPMYKGKLTIFVFDKRYEYDEFGRMVEKRTLPSDVAVHFKYDVIDCYAGLVAPKEADPNFPALLSEAFAGAYVDTLGRNVPRWFTVGTGMAVAAKAHPRAPVVTQWEKAIAAAVARGSSSFLDAKELDGSDSVMAFGFVRALMSQASKHQQVLDQMVKGTPFDRAFQQAYGNDPKTICGQLMGR